MKKLIFVIVASLGITIMGCGSENKNDTGTDSLVDTSDAGPGLDSGEMTSDTLSMDTTTIDTTNTSNQPN